jgi:hypothetical protein
MSINYARPILKIRKICSTNPKGKYAIVSIFEFNSSTETVSD